MTLRQCYKEYVSDWYDDQHQGTTISEGNTTINGKQAKWMEYQFGTKGSMISLVYLIYCDEKFFLISTLSSSKQFPKYKEKFEVVINSFTENK